MRPAVRAILILAATLALCLPLLAQKKLSELIVGKWEPVEADKVKVVIEFARDGKLLISAAEKTIRGTYRVLDDSSVEVTIDVEGKPQTEKLRVSFEQDEMTTVDSRGKKDTFRRIK
jgi:uncharacterized protein (TIGR03066 family)